MRTTTAAKPESTQSFTPVRSPLLQRKCACGNSAGLTGTCSECQKTNLTLQRRSTDPSEVSEVPPIVHEVLRSPGQPIDSDTRTMMESRFGHDFSQVRVHTNNQAAQSAQSVNALAYAVGKNVVFGSGRYAPQTTAGRKVLAHELTHVLQQGSMSETIAPLKVGSSNDFYEQEAEAQAEKVVSTNEPIATPTQRHTSAVQRLGDLTKVPGDLSCLPATSGAPPATESLLFANRETALIPLQRLQIEHFVANWRAVGASTPVRVDGFASQVGADDLNWRLSCDRAQAVVAELQSPTSGAVSGIPASFITVFAQGETDEFGAVEQNRQVTINTPILIPTPPPTPPPSCLAAIPTTTPSTCADRHIAYCNAAACFPSNPWLACACVASEDVCRAVEAFTFTSAEGAALLACIVSPPPASLGSVRAKGAWLLSTNQCIWGHWRAALESIHNPTLTIPSSLTSEWLAAVTTCRSSGVGSRACCAAHVRAEQTAIDRCGLYNSTRFGSLPTDVPGAPLCSAIVRALSPGLPFTGDFGRAFDRIIYGIRRCC